MTTNDKNHQRLLARPVEEDTRILSVQFRRCNEIPILLERWNWEGIHASTAVFLTEHVAAMDDAALESLLSEQAGLDLSGGVTIVRRETHTFVNFGFDAK